MLNRVLIGFFIAFVIYSAINNSRFINESGDEWESYKEALDEVARNIGIDVDMIVGPVTPGTYYYYSTDNNDFSPQEILHSSTNNTVPLEWLNYSCVFWKTLPTIKIISPLKNSAKIISNSTLDLPVELGFGHCDSENPKLTLEINTDVLEPHVVTIALSKGEIATAESTSIAGILSFDLVKGKDGKVHDTFTYEYTELPTYILKVLVNSAHPPKAWQEGARAHGDSLL